MAHANEPQLAAVIVNHDQGPAVRTQLQAFRDQEPEAFAATEWLLVQNGTEEVGPAEGAEGGRLLDRVRFERMPNRGYGAAINLALRRTRAPYLLALNADLLPEPGFLAGVHGLIRDVLPNEPRRVGIVGFRLLNHDGTLQGSAGRFPTLLRLLAGLLRRREDRKYLATPAACFTPAPWVTGACVLLSRAGLEAVGGFDEGFFMYYEDVDICKRCWRAGWHVMLDSRLAVRHFHPYHTRPLTHRLVYLARHGLLRYFWKHRPRWEFALLGRIMLAECWWRGRQQGWEVVEQMVRGCRANPATFVIDAARLP